jgi:hypothetical protein
VELSTDGGRSYSRVLVQEYTFSPRGATFSWKTYTRAPRPESSAAHDCAEQAGIWCSHTDVPAPIPLILAATVRCPRQLNVSVPADPYIAPVAARPLRSQRPVRRAPGRNPYRLAGATLNEGRIVVLPRG